MGRVIGERSRGSEKMRHLPYQREEEEEMDEDLNKTHLRDLFDHRYPQSELFFR